MKVFLDETTNTTGAFKTTSPGTYKMIVEGTLGGATVTPEISVDGTNYVPLVAGLTAAGCVDFTLPENADTRVNITGGTAASISVDVFPVDSVYV